MPVRMRMSESWSCSLSQSCPAGPAERSSTVAIKITGKRFLISPRDLRHDLTRLRNRCLRKTAGKGHERHHQRATPKHGPRVQHRVASDLRFVPNDCPEFFQSRGIITVRAQHHDRLLIESQIRTNYAGAKMSAVAENRVPHVAEMRHLHAVHQQAVLELTRVAEHAAFANDHVSADK